MHLNKKDLKEIDKIKRLNIINAVSGIKSANLIGTISSNQQTNLAVFSSVIHLGSNPALLGFISRPGKLVPRHTLENIKENKFYTINHINESIVEQAHYTSAKFDKDQSEFELCGLSEEYLYGFKAPFVKESHLKLGMQFLECLPIKANGTVLIIGEITEIVIPDAAIDDKGHINIGQINTVGISGLNNYYQVLKITSFPYARVNELPDFSNQ
jgi:flavin reductase (DIM6/NTAB) family NADH-FMN oxidoreductase RutF